MRPGNQARHRLAGSGTAGHLRPATYLAAPIGDFALTRVQERAPRRERVGEDELQLLRSGDESDRSGSALHGSDQIVRIHLLGPRAGGQQPGDFILGLVHGHPAGQRVQRRVFGLQATPRSDFQICLAGEQPNHRQEVLLDAEPGQVGVADVPEQPPAVGSRRVEGRLMSGWRASSSSSSRTSSTPTPRLTLNR